MKKWVSLILLTLVATFLAFASPAWAEQKSESKSFSFTSQGGVAGRNVP